MNRQDHLARTSTRVDLAFSALPDAPVVTAAGTSRTGAPVAAAAPVRRVRHRLAAGLQRTATWVEPTRPHSAA